MFSIRVKELFETIVLRKKKPRVFALFESISWETNLWVTLSDFTAKTNKQTNKQNKQTRKIGKGNLYLTENRLSRNEMWCASDNDNNMCHICAKNFWIQTLSKELFPKYQFLRKLPQISYIHKMVIFKYNWNFWKKYTSGPRYWNVPVLVNTGTFLVYQYCLKMWYLRSLERAGCIQKQTILERQNSLVLSNTRVPVSGTWSILFPIFFLDQPLLPYKFHFLPVVSHQHKWMEMYTRAHLRFTGSNMDYFHDIEQSFSETG